ncbi:hypothetical protein Tco_0649193 [Tanacetum coccineum]
MLGIAKLSFHLHHCLRHVSGGRLLEGGNIEEAKSFVEDKDYAVKSAEDGTADLKKTVKELAKSLADYEKKLEVYVGLVTCVRAKLLKCCNDFEQGDEVVALEKKLDIIQKDENIEKGLKFLAYDEGRMESIQKVCLLSSIGRNNFLEYLLKQNFTLIEFLRSGR